MEKYIENKKVDTTKSNNVRELQNIGKAAWKFISTLYNTEWDSLVCNIHNNTFRQKVSYYCTLKTTPVKSNKPNIKDMTKPASIERIPPSIPTNIPKEVNKISKFFKLKKLAQANAGPNKSYTQASKIGSNTESVLKIKEVFSTLKAKSIDNIQRMIKGDGKPKPCINITTNCCGNY